MVKFRVIPTILTDGMSQVKGSKFNNWRTVGSVMQAVRVHSRRDVDELVLLDVSATSQGRTIDPGLVRRVSATVRIPFTVGGGISSVQDVERLLAAGADKIVLGTAAAANVRLVDDLSSVFGAQAIVCSVDSEGSGIGRIGIFSGKEFVKTSPEQFATELEMAGAGELLLQSIFHDGGLKGMNHELLLRIAPLVSIPISFSSGAAGPEDFFQGYSAGASAVCAGALFQFTEVTPKIVKDYLLQRGVPVRVDSHH